MSITLHPEDSRLTTFPIHRPALWQYYRDAARSFWDVDELDLSQDAQHFEHRLNKKEQHFVKHILAFFSSSDGIVNLNLVKRFKKDVPILEVGYFYDFQVAMENVHANAYSLTLDTIIKEKAERDRLLNAMHTIPIITKMTNYMFDCIKSDVPLPERLLRMACVEGIFFTGCFCVIYWLQARGLMPGLGQSNELIARDEGLHTMFAMKLYTMCNVPLSTEKVHHIIAGAVAIAKEFINDALPEPLEEMNAEMLTQHIQASADNLMVLIDCPTLYGSKTPFHYMDMLNTKLRGNFFERRDTQYAKASVATTHEEIATDF